MDEDRSGKTLRPIHETIDQNKLSHAHLPLSAAISMAPSTSTPDSVVSPANTAIAILAPTVVEAELVSPNAEPDTMISIDSLRRNSVIRTSDAALAPSTTPTTDYFSQQAERDSIDHKASSTRAAETSSQPERQAIEIQLVQGGMPELSRSISAHSMPPTCAPTVTYPEYPDQALSSLYSKPTLRATSFPYNDPRNSQSQSSFFPQHASAARLAPWRDPRLSRTTRTAGNTPAHTPGLFAFGPAMHASATDGPSDRTPLPSPYLHPVQVPPPRTTRSAQRDVDFMSGRKMINRYEIIDELGRGVHGKVKLARNLETGDEVAIKIVQRYSKRRRLGKADVPEDKVKKEIAILKKVQHPNVVRLIEVIDDPDISKVYIVLEFCEQRELVWRTDGLSHIVLMEYYQQERDANAASADESNASIDEVKLLAARRRGQHARKRLAAIRATQSSGFPDLWSLEYAADSDEDSLDDANVGDKTVSNSPRYTAAPIASSNQVDVQTVTSGAGLDTASALSTTPSAEANKGTCQDAGYSFYSTEWYQEQNGQPDIAAIDEDLRRQRQASVAESISSQLTEKMDLKVPLESRHVPAMTLDECRSAIRDALVGLEYLHYNGIIHRDIKPENLLRTRDSRVKISDFGVSYLGKPIREGDDSANNSEAESADFEDEAAFAKTVGTPAFYAPELCRLDLDSDAPVAKHQVDIWALGITLFCLIFARTPFDADNEFALMRRIREEEIFIPRTRLMAVDPTAPVRSPGHAPLFQQSKRNPHDFQHEPVDDDLHDLLKRFFQKDPAKRITIKEIKHHPWILQNLEDFATPLSWIEATDPSRVDHGKKIEVSSQELQDAVMPIHASSILNRLRSIGKRATTAAFGLGGRRRRDQSSASSEASSSTTSITEQFHRESRGTSRARFEKEADHPLSRSVTASPDFEEQRDHLMEDPVSPTSQPVDAKPKTPINAASRPSMPARHASEVSTTASIRTVKPSDYERGRSSSFSPPSPEVPDFSLSSNVPSALGAVLGSARRNLLHALHSKDNSPVRSAAALPTVHGPPHGEITSVASTTSSPGYLDFPYDLREKLSAIGPPSGNLVPPRHASLAESSSSSTRNSVPSTWQRSVAAGRGDQATTSAQLSSAVSSSSVEAMYSHGVSISGTSNTTEADYRHAKDELVRRRALQDIQDQEYARSKSSRPSNSLDRPQPCPPSPDDEVGVRLMQHTSPANYFGRPFYPPSASSEDPSEASHSRSTSFPSCPSALSADSSIYSDAERFQEAKDDSANSSEGTTDARTHVPNSPLPRIASTSDDGYHGDGDGGFAPGLDDDEDSSDYEEDEFLTITSRKNLSHPVRRRGTRDSTAVDDAGKGVRSRRARVTRGF